MRRMVRLAAVAAVVLAVGCGGSGKKPHLADDAKEDQGTGDGIGLDGTAADGVEGDRMGPDDGIILPDGMVDGRVAPDVEPETACEPQCDGKECGADGCGGSCGACAGHDVCNESGSCEPPVCESSKDCPGDLICFKSEGVCVECVADADCGENQKCQADHTCIDVVPCESDKDCKLQDMVCDKEAGICVECLLPADCPEGWLCLQQICLEVVCELGDLHCAGNDIETCNATGTGWDFVESCPEEQFCVEGECVDQLCVPDSEYCDGEVAILCNGDGSGFAKTTDCAKDLLFCSAGECTDCKPQCENKSCGDDGCGGNCGTCPPGIPCIESAPDVYTCGTPCDIAAMEKRGDGCEFWAVDLDNVEGGQFEKVGLFVAVSKGNGPAKLKVDRFENGQPIALSAEELSVASLEVDEGAATKLILPSGMDIDGSMLASKAVRVRANVPISVKQFNPLNGSGVFTSDASLLLPIHLDGKEYIALSWPQRTSGYTLRGNVAIVGTGEGDTFIQVWPTSAVKAGAGVTAMAANSAEPYEFALKAGDVLALETDGQQGADLTGTRVVASKPVAVFGAHECANVPLGTNYCDHIEQQLLPVSGWGTLYVGDAFAPRSPNQKDVWRVVASEDGTQVALSPAIAGPLTLNKGQMAEFYSGQHFVLEASAPVLLGHYLQGSNFSGFQTYPECSMCTGIGDPAFTISLPTDSFRNGYRFYVPTDYEQDYVNVIASTQAGTDILLDGVSLAGSGVPIGATGFQVFQVPVQDGAHELVSTGSPIGLTSYGYDCDVSYAYPSL